MRWILTLLGVNDIAREQATRDQAIASLDGGCPICDHPFGNMRHVCLA
jgi:hypothetical protein